MKSSKVIISIILTILALPILSIISLSFQSTNSNYFEWYTSIVKNDGFVAAIIITLIVSTITTIFTVIISIFLSLSWFNKRNRAIVLILVIVLGLMPGDIIALSITKLSQMLGFYSSNLVFLIFGLVLYCIPFGVLILWSRYYFIESSLIRSAQDLGIKRNYIIANIIIPLSKLAIISCATLSFLLAFNEYPRTYYLSGSFELVSEYFNGKLGSGADPSIYAGSSINILLTIVVIAALVITQLVLNKKISVLK